MPRAEYGHNNSDTEDSDDDRLHDPDLIPWAPPPPREKRGIPTECFSCGLPVTIRRPTNGIHAGRKYYVCEAPEAEFEGNHTYRWWDEVMEEEVSDLKQEVEKMKDSIQYITHDAHGASIDPRMMWARVSLLRDEIEVKINTCVADMKFIRLGFEKAEEEFKKLQNILLRGKN